MNATEWYSKVKFRQICCLVLLFQNLREVLISSLLAVLVAAKQRSEFHSVSIYTLAPYPGIQCSV